MFGAPVKTSSALAVLCLALTACAQSGGSRDAVIRCTPGERVDVSCGCLGLGTACEGNAGIRLCDATLANGACTDAEAVTIAGDRDQCSEGCPLATTYCPSSGMVAVSTFAYEDFLGETGSYACRWAARSTPIAPTRPSTTFACQAGELVRASCGCMGLGRFCDGDPTMRACAPGQACTDTASSLDYNDDTCDRCPLVEATCPTAGAIVITTSPLSGGSYRCDVGAIGQSSGPLRAMGI